MNLQQYKEPEFDTYLNYKSPHVNFGDISDYISLAVFHKKIELIDLAISQIQEAKRRFCKRNDLTFDRDSYLKVMDLGARKYGKNNWLETGTNSSLLHRYKSAMGHISRGFYGTEPFDTESGELHFDHGICCLQMIKVMVLRGISW